MEIETDWFVAGSVFERSMIGWEQSPDVININDSRCLGDEWTVMHSPRRVL